MTFYNKEGMPAAYLDKDREHIYLFDGTPAAYIVEGAVYSFEGLQYGWFDRGWIRDLEGYCVLFTDEARIGGPAKPSRHETVSYTHLPRPVPLTNGTPSPLLTSN